MYFPAGSPFPFLATHATKTSTSIGSQKTLVDNHNQLDCYYCSTMESVVSLNNTAVHSLECGEIDSARDCLQLAIDELFELSCEEKVFGSESSTEMTVLQRQQALHILVNGWSKPISPSSNERLSCEGVFLFARAVLLKRPPQQNASTEHPVNTSFILDLYSTITLYNKAILYHVLACQSAESDLAQNAYDHYELAYLSCRRIDPGYTYFETQMLNLALFNNMGALFYCDMARFQDASQCFRATYGLIFRIDVNELRRVLGAEEIEHFSTNIFLIPCCSTPAA
jgi:hypothetical protein